MRQAYWNPRSPKVFTDRPLGVGWAVNVPTLLRRLGVRSESKGALTSATTSPTRSPGGARQLRGRGLDWDGCHPCHAAGEDPSPMRRLLSIPIAALMSLLIAGTAFAAFCGNDSKLDGAGQTAVTGLPSTRPPRQLHRRSPSSRARTPAEAQGRVRRPSSSTSTVTVRRIASSTTRSSCPSTRSDTSRPGQVLDGLAVNPAVHRGHNPGGQDRRRVRRDRGMRLTEISRDAGRRSGPLIASGDFCARIGSQ